MMVFMEQIEPPPPLVSPTVDEQLQLRLEAIAEEDRWVKNFIDRLAGVIQELEALNPAAIRALPSVVMRSLPCR